MKARHVFFIIFSIFRKLRDLGLERAGEEGVVDEGRAVGEGKVVEDKEAEAGVGERVKARKGCKSLMSSV